MNVCGLDLSALNVPYPNYELLQDVSKVLGIYDDIPSLKYRFWNKRESIENDKAIIIHFDKTRAVIKSSRGEEIDIGKTLNELKKEIPTFAYVYGGFKCSSSYFTPDGFHHRGCSYKGYAEHVMYEFIDGITYDYFQGTEEELWVVAKILIQSIYIAHERFGFTHNDLIMSNIMIVDLGEKYVIDIGDKEFVSKYLPVIIDYGRSGFDSRSKSDNDISYILRNFAISAGVRSSINTNDLKAIIADYENRYGITESGAFPVLKMGEYHSIGKGKRCPALPDEEEYDELNDIEKLLQLNGSLPMTPENIVELGNSIKTAVSIVRKIIQYNYDIKPYQLEEKFTNYVNMNERVQSMRSEVGSRDDDFFFPNFIHYGYISLMKTYALRNKS